MRDARNKPVLALVRSLQRSKAARRREAASRLLLKSSLNRVSSLCKPILNRSRSAWLIAPIQAVLQDGPDQQNRQHDERSRVQGSAPGEPRHVLKYSVPLGLESPTGRLGPTVDRAAFRGDGLRRASAASRSHVAASQSLMPLWLNSRDRSCCCRHGSHLEGVVRGQPNLFHGSRKCSRSSFHGRELRHETCGT